MVNQDMGGIPLKGLENNAVQVPQELLHNQKELGLEAVMLWIQLAAFAQRGEAVSTQALAECMGIPRARVETHLAALADRGWINDEGMEIRLSVPPVSPAETELDGPEEDTPQAPPKMLDPGQAQFEWLVNFWSHRVGAADPDIMRKLLFWMEQKGMSHEVIAVAIEEMCTNAQRPTLAYLDGVLRNWYQEGIREYQDLTERPHLAKVLPANTQEQRIHPDAERKWKELFPDEFDQ